jgi:hypothetical protein
MPSSTSAAKSGRTIVVPTKNRNIQQRLLGDYRVVSLLLASTDLPDYVFTVPIRGVASEVPWSALMDYIRSQGYFVLRLLEHFDAAGLSVPHSYRVLSWDVTRALGSSDTGCKWFAAFEKQITVQGVWKNTMSLSQLFSFLQSHPVLAHTRVKYQLACTAPVRKFVSALEGALDQARGTIVSRAVTFALHTAGDSSSPVSLSSLPASSLSTSASAIAAEPSAGKCPAHQQVAIPAMQLRTVGSNKLVAVWPASNPASVPSVAAAPSAAAAAPAKSRKRRAEKQPDEPQQPRSRPALQVQVQVHIAPIVAASQEADLVTVADSVSSSASSSDDEADDEADGADEAAATGCDATVAGEATESASCYSSDNQEEDDNVDMSRTPVTMEAAPYSSYSLSPAAEPEHVQTAAAEAAEHDTNALIEHEWFGLQLRSSSIPSFNQNKFDAHMHDGSSNGEAEPLREFNCDSLLNSDY